MAGRAGLLRLLAGDLRAVSPLAARAGVWQQLVTALQARADAAGLIDWQVSVRAMRDDPAMLACCGTSPTVMLAGVMTASGGLAGLAGALGAPIVGVGPGTGEQVLLLSLIVVVLGGLDNIAGTLLAAIAVGQVQSVEVLLLPHAAPFLLFAAMAGALLLRRRPLLLTAGGPR